MVYESDFYTTRRYRTSPSLSTYTVSYQPSKQVRILPGLGKRVCYVRKAIPGLDTHTIYRPGTLSLHSVVNRPDKLHFDQLDYKRHWYDTNSLYANPINTRTSIYYHHVVERPLKVYYNILGYPIWSRYWYRYWSEIPKGRYSDYYNNDFLNSPPYNISRISWNSYLPNATYKYWHSRPLANAANYTDPSWYKLSSSWWKHVYPSLSSERTPQGRTVSVSPYWSKYWTNVDSPYFWSTYWQPTWSRYWRQAGSCNWTKWYDARMYYRTYPITDYQYISSPSSLYYHSIIGRPLRLYHDILGLPRYSRYWYRYWYDVPSTRYSDYYDSDLISYRYWPSYLSRWSYLSPSWYRYLSPSWYKYWYPSLSYSSSYPISRSWYPSITNWYPSLSTSWYNYLSPYWSKSWTSTDLPYHWSTYWTPSWSRYWRSVWSRYWYRYYDAIFNDETSRIRADAASVLKRIHTPVIRTSLSMLPYNTRYSEPILTSRITSDDYIYKMLSTSPYNAKVQYTTYYSEPVRKYIGSGHLAAVTYSGGKPYGRRGNIYVYQDPVKDDIQLLSYYINKFRSDKALTSREAAAPLSPARPSRHFAKVTEIPEPVKQEKSDLDVDRAAIRLAQISQSQEEVEEKLRRQKEAARLAEEKALVEEAARKKTQALKEEAARKAELARQEELAAQAAAERAAELERKAEQAKQEELAKQAEIERIRREEEERARLEEEKKIAEFAKAEEERQQLIRLEEIARQAEEERERELARQAEELAELARQEAELEEQARLEAETAAKAKQEKEHAELARQEAELLELEKQEKELAELARQEAELAELAKHEANLAKQEAEIADLATQEAELKELEERQQAELDALEAEAKALEEAFPQDEPAAECEEEEPAMEATQIEDADAAEEEAHEEEAHEEEAVEEEAEPAVVEIENVAEEEQYEEEQLTTEKEEEEEEAVSPAAEECAEAEEEEIQEE